MIFFLNTNFSLSFYKRTRSSSFIRTRSSWIFYTRFFWTRITRIKRIFYFAHGSRILPTALWTRDFFWTRISRDSPKAHWPTGSNNTNLFGMRIFLFFIRTRISRISRIFLPTAVLDYGILGFLMRHKKWYPWAMRSIGRSVRSVRSVWPKDIEVGVV